MNFNIKEADQIKLFEKIFHEAPLGILFLNKELQVIDKNSFAESLLKTKTNKIIGKNLEDFCEEYNIESPTKKVKKLPINTDIKTQGYTRNETLVWNFIPFNNDGKFPISFIATIKNLQPSNDVNYYLRYIIDHLPHAILWKDARSKFLGCNLAVAKSAQFSSVDEIVGKTDYDMPWSKEQSDEYVADDKSVLKTKKPKLNYEETQTQPDGSTKTLLVSKVPMLDDSHEANGILCVYTDITDRKKAEKELQEEKDKAEAANHAKSQFLGIMSHELRTPLNVMKLALQTLKTTSLTDEQLELVEVVEQSSKGQLELIEDILDFAKLDAGKLDFKYAPFDVHALANSVIKGLSHLVEERPIKLRYEIDSGIPNYVLGDEKRIRQLLINFLNNALKFTEKGSVKLHLERLDKTNESITLRFNVIDTGIGIPEDKVEYVFERFAQIENNSSKYARKYQGVGLGLAICKQIVEKMQGNIGVESEFGKGSCFYFDLTLPIPSARELKQHKKVVAEEQAAYDISAATNAKILVVDDHEMIRFVTNKLLTAIGCKHLTFISEGEDAVPAILNNDYDIVFMDISLGHISGLDLIEEIRKQEKKTGKHTPIIAATAHAAEEDRENCFNAGADDVIKKPASREALSKAIYDFVIKKKK